MSPVLKREQFSNALISPLNSQYFPHWGNFPPVKNPWLRPFNYKSTSRRSPHVPLSLRCGLSFCLTLSSLLLVRLQMNFCANELFICCEELEQTPTWVGCHGNGTVRGGESRYLTEGYTVPCCHADGSTFLKIEGMVDAEYVTMATDSGSSYQWETCHLSGFLTSERNQWYVKKVIESLLKNY